MSGPMVNNHNSLWPGVSGARVRQAGQNEDLQWVGSGLCCSQEGGSSGLEGCCCVEAHGPLGSSGQRSGGGRGGKHMLSHT